RRGRAPRLPPGRDRESWSGPHERIRREVPRLLVRDERRPAATSPRRSTRAPLSAWPLIVRNWRAIRNPLRGKVSSVLGGAVLPPEGPGEAPGAPGTAGQPEEGPKPDEPPR